MKESPSRSTHLDIGVLFLYRSFTVTSKIRIMFKFFVAGGPVFMAVLTIVLVCMFFAAWKAPRWVKEIGAFAIVFGIFSSLAGIIQMLGTLQEIGNVETGVLCGGFKVTLIPTVYGMIIYMVSLIIRIIEKPRI